MIDIYKQNLIGKLKEALSENTFVKLTLSSYSGQKQDLKNIYIKPVLIRDEEMLSFVFKYTTKDITKNFNSDEAVLLVEKYFDELQSVRIFTTKEDVVFDNNKIKITQSTFTEPANKSHDKEKHRMISPQSEFLHQLGITTKEGQVKADKYDKYKQIDKFVEIVDKLYTSSSLVGKQHLDILDLGSGKSYLTFTLYHYFNDLVKKEVTIKGIELRSGLVDVSNDLAEKSDYGDLEFIGSAIKDFSADSADIVVALHACDTATDDAIVKGIELNAEVIIFAPCCHHYVRQVMKKSDKHNDLLKHGILEQRQSEIVTDGLRAMTLEYFGYKTQVIEFISSEYTSKNILITAVRNSTKKKPEVLERIKDTKSKYGLSDYYLDKELHF